jgi:hypothetical protein
MGDTVTGGAFRKAFLEHGRPLAVVVMGLAAVGIVTSEKGPEPSPIGPERPRRTGGPVRDGTSLPAPAPRGRPERCGAEASASTRATISRIAALAAFNAAKG